MFQKHLIYLLLVGSISLLWANPYPKQKAVYENPNDTAPILAPFALAPKISQEEIKATSRDAIRVEVKWKMETDSYEFSYAVIEKSGSQALLDRSKHRDKLGSYHGFLQEPKTGKSLAFSSLGTGQEYRFLTRAFTFRFPLVSEPVEFCMEAENPISGKLEEVIRQTIDPKKLSRLALAYERQENLEVRLLKAATKSPKLFVNVYAEGYLAHRRDQFWQDAPRVVQRLSEKKLPMIEHLEFRGVFAPSATALGKAKVLGTPVPERNSFLGLYYPYWHNFGRWYHIVYPTRESRYRAGIGMVPYDYPIVLVDSNLYWGVGNFKEHTAIPAQSSSFTYLLMHELGHYFGLNEEYNSGGKTELAFAPGIKEPWSQNITFLNDPNKLKWKKFVSSKTPIPTPSFQWTKGNYGAYKGGYAQTAPLGKSHKPGLSCIMDRGGNFCPICQEAIAQRVLFDLGIAEK